MMNTTAIAAALTLALQSTGGGAAPVPEASRAHPEMWPAAHSPAAMTDAKTEAFVRDLLARMTVEEKVGQTIQADIASIKPEDLLTKYPLGRSGGRHIRSPAATTAPRPGLGRHGGGLPRGGGPAPGARVPLLFGVDAVHGHNNIVGATIFPHNIGLGAARDPGPDPPHRRGDGRGNRRHRRRLDLRSYLAVPRDDRWGRAYEGYAEDPEVQALYAGADDPGPAGRCRRPTRWAQAMSPARPSISWPTAAPRAARTRATPRSRRGRSGPPTWAVIRPRSTPAPCRSWPPSRAGTGSSTPATDPPDRRAERAVGLRRLRGRRLERPRPAARLHQHQLRPEP
jgi:hypothetical protein